MNETRKFIPAEKLQRRLSEIDRNLTDLRGEYERIRDEISTLESHRALLASLLNDAIPESSGNGQESPKSTTDILINHILTNPGQSTGEIVDSLEGVIESKSSDKRQMLYTMVSNLRRRGLVRRDESGGHFAVGRDE